MTKLSETQKASIQELAHMPAYPGRDTGMDFYQYLLGKAINGLCRMEANDTRTPEEIASRGHAIVKAALALMPTPDYSDLFQ